MSIRVGSVSVEVVPDARGFAEKLRAQLADVGGVTIDVKADTAVVDAQLAELAKDRTAQIRAEVAEAAKAAAELDETAKERKARLQAEADVAKAEAQLAAVAKARSTSIKAEADIASAEIKLAEVTRKRDAAIKAEADKAAAAAAKAELDVIAKERTAKIKADADGPSLDKINEKFGTMGTVMAAAAGFAPILGASLIAATAGAAVAATGVAAGMGVLLLGMHGITGAIQAQDAAGKAAATDAIAQTQKRLADTAAVKAAEDGLTNAEASASNGAISAAEAVAGAKQSAVDAAISAAQSVAQALTTERNAENTLVSAQQSEQRAQESLTKARKDAQRQLEDLAQQAADGALSQRGAVLSLDEATQSLHNTMADPLATNLQRERAQLNYDQAKQQLTDISTANQRTAQDKATADAKGVDGAQGVISAQDQLRASIVAVGAAQTGIAKAQLDYANAQRLGAESVAKAEQGVSDALRAQSEQARTSAASIVTAQAAVTAAQRTSVTDAKTATTAQQALATAMAALSPAGQKFVDFYKSTLKPAFKDLAASAQTAMLPGLQQGLQSIISSGVMTNLKEAISKIATVLGELFQKAGQALGSPAWKQFIDFIGNTAGPVLKILAATFSNIGKGLSSLLQAFTPVALQMGLGLQNMTEKFAAWAAGLSKTQGFKDFIQYLKDNGPKLLDTLKQVADALIHVGVSVSPLTGVYLQGLKDFATVISALPTWAIIALTQAIAALKVAMAFDKAYTAIALLATKWGLVTAAAGSATVAEATATEAGAGAGVGGAVTKVGLLSKVWTGLKIAALAVGAAVSLTVGLIIGVIIAWGVVLWEIVSRWREVKSAFMDDVWSPMKHGFEAAAHAVGAAMKGMANGVIWAINAIIGAWDAMHFKVPGINVGPIHTPSFDLGLPQIPKIPMLAQGGIVTSPTLAMVGESGPEAVVPLGQAGLAASLNKAGLPGVGQSAAPEVRVFIGNQELTHIVRTQVIQHDNGQARQLAYGRAA